MLTDSLSTECIILRQHPQQKFRLIQKGIHMLDQLRFNGQSLNFQLFYFPCVEGRGRVSKYQEDRVYSSLLDPYVIVIVPGLYCMNHCPSHFTALVLGHNSPHSSLLTSIRLMLSSWHTQGTITKGCIFRGCQEGKKDLLSCLAVPGIDGHFHITCLVLSTQE